MYLDGVEKLRGFAEKQRLYVKSFEYYMAQRGKYVINS